ncbi:FAD-dependent monooxygenase (plasmid) [Halococcus dombrowskii]|uniref:FAD-dependent monooxygenase n=2 Tax=Halococcus dombrowskii TaxID=179637 RepID=A0AAX3ASV4_HALDO|nr:FAD-dependent monooxygenase [Halococcus dombrowskii]UOO97176.1 FAD-dependent monooxygenase [Halococcus dombrowskii]
MTDDESVCTVEVDAVVVGAGPAGCMLSHLLARSGVETILLERQSSLDREFHGYAFQPSALRLFNDIDLVEDVLALNHAEITQFGVDLYGHTRTLIDFTTLPAPHDFVLSIEQPPLLRLLVDATKRFETFEFRNAMPVQDLIVEDGTVVGVRATDREANKAVEVRAQVVVGADGRFSTVRSVADIDPGLFETDFQVVWLKVPSTVPHETQVRINEHGQVLYFGLGTDLQLGWLIPKGTYPAIREAGIESFRERIAAVDPRLRDGLASVTSFNDCSLLNVAPGLSDGWVRDGLVLIGDAAHVASPVAGQGNALAIQDAAVLHSIVVRALDRTAGVLSAQDLRPYVQRRCPAVQRVVNAQLLGHRAISALVHHGNDVPDIMKRGILRTLLTLAGTDPIMSRTRRLIAFGPDSVRVETELFE